MRVPFDGLVGLLEVLAMRIGDRNPLVTDLKVYCASLRHQIGASVCRLAAIRLLQSLPRDGDNQWVIVG